MSQIFTRVVVCLPLTFITIFSTPAIIRAENTPEAAGSPSSTHRPANPFTEVRQKVAGINLRMQDLVVQAREEVERLETITGKSPLDSPIRELRKLNEDISDIHSEIGRLIAGIEESDEDDDRRRVKELRRERNNQAEIYAEWVEMYGELLKLFDSHPPEDFLGGFINESVRMDRDRVQVVEDYLQRFENSDVSRINIQAFSVGKRETSLRGELLRLKSRTRSGPISSTVNLPGLTEWFRDLADELKSTSRKSEYEEPSLPEPHHSVQSIAGRAGRPWWSLTVEEAASLIIEEKTIEIGIKEQDLDEARRLGSLLLDSRENVEEVWSQIEELPLSYHPGYVY